MNQNVRISQVHLNKEKKCQTMKATQTINSTKVSSPNITSKIKQI